MEKNPEHLTPDNALAFISDDGGQTYNRCHCEYICETDA
jgi:alpha 1,2-mannosyltransferase